MFNKTITLTEFILKEEKKFKNATGSLTLLLTQIENATKIIASHLKKSGLVDVLGKTGDKNFYGEEVQKMDRFSNEVLIETLSESGQVSVLASEELTEPIFINKNKGKYIVFFDPLDGSSNLDVNINVGTIFSIYHQDRDLLLPGIKQVAAGYVIYGTSVMFVYSFGQGVNGFTLDPSIGAFLLSHPNIKIPKKNHLYSINEGNFNLFDHSIKEYLNFIKTKDKPYKLRYIGSMVADLHRIILQGGIFLYPADKKNPQGKLRLMFEINPFSFLIFQAGGMAISQKTNPLKIKPTSISQKAPIVLGSIENVKEYLLKVKFSNL